MKFYIDIDVRDMPTTEYPTSAGSAFKDLPADQGDVLFVNGSNFEHSICFRDGREYKGREKGPSDVCTIMFEDFVPGLSLDDNPDWYDLLKGRVVAVRANERYGPGQGIVVTEHITHGCAVARVRNQQANWGRNGELVYEVKILAKGLQSLQDARTLHSMILDGQQ